MSLSQGNILSGRTRPTVGLLPPIPNSRQLTTTHPHHLESNILSEPNNSASFPDPIVQYRESSEPVQLTNIPVDSVRSLTVLHDELFVVHRQLADVDVYDVAALERQYERAGRLPLRRHVVPAVVPPGNADKFTVQACVSNDNIYIGVAYVQSLSNRLNRIYRISPVDGRVLLKWNVIEDADVIAMSVDSRTGRVVCPGLKVGMVYEYSADGIAERTCDLSKLLRLDIPAAAAAAAVAEAAMNWSLVQHQDSYLVLLHRTGVPSQSLPGVSPALHHVTITRVRTRTAADAPEAKPEAILVSQLSGVTSCVLVGVDEFGCPLLILDDKSSSSNQSGDIRTLGADPYSVRAADNVVARPKYVLAILDAGQLNLRRRVYLDGYDPELQGAGHAGSPPLCVDRSRGRLLAVSCDEQQLVVFDLWKDGFHLELL